MLVVVGGHSRNIGKTSVMSNIIRTVPEACWTAVKITQYGHGMCATGDGCDCAAGDDHPYALTAEQQPNSHDSGRFLSAGAARAYWLRTAQGKLGYAVDTLRKLIADSPNTILESNSVLEFFHPDLYIPVIDFSTGDIKDSLRRHLDRAHAIVQVARGGEVAEAWKPIPRRWFEKPLFRVTPPDYMNAALTDFVREHLVRRAAGLPSPAA